MNNSFFILIVFFAAMYFMMIRPQQKQQKKRTQMLNSLDVGDKIVTIGGLHGKISGIQDAEGTLQLEIAPNVIVTLQQNAVGFVKVDEDFEKALDDEDVEEVEAEEVR